MAETTPPPFVRFTLVYIPSAIVLGMAMESLPIFWIGLYVVISTIWLALRVFGVVFHFLWHGVESQRDMHPEERRPERVTPKPPTSAEIEAQRRREYEGILQSHHRELEAIDRLPVDDETRADLKTRSERNLLRRADPYLR